MSYKEHLINLLQQEVKPKISSPSKKSLTSIKLHNVNRNKFENEILKKKRKRNLKRHQKKSYQYNETDGIKSISSHDSKEEVNFSNRNFIRTYSDSDVEINISTSSDGNWINEIQTNITPSKSESEKSISSRLCVDTIYHIGNDNSNTNIFSSSEDSEKECFDETETSLLSNITSETIEIQEESLNVNCYTVKNGKILILKNKNHVYLHGSFRLSVMYGHLHLLGYNLTPAMNEVEVYSLRGFSYLFVENIHDGDYSFPDHEIKTKLRKIGANKSDILNILSELNPHDSILICSQLNNLKLPYIEKHVTQKLLPAFSDGVPIAIKDDITDLNVIKCNTQWDDISKMINNESKVMICGGKGVGKSTLLRYVINRLLMNFNSVLVIDLDPGQPEFTIPGCVSAVVVKQPLFGPNFTHLQKPVRCIFLENIDVTSEPDVYIQSIIELLNQCKELRGIPILVNYMGYTQSYGINIASTIITYVCPTILVQINSYQQNKNFSEHLTPDVVVQNSNMFGNATKNLFYELVIADSMSDGLNSWQAHSRTIREMCVTSYVSEIVDDSLTLTSRNVPLYRISLKDVKFIESSSKTCTNKPAIFNANLVSLCTPASTDNIYNCHGWGIIRGIDQEMLILITPVSQEVLEMVTHLAIGSVTLPPSMLMYEDTNVGLVPYVSLGSISTFNQIPKRSFVPKKNNSL